MVLELVGFNVGSSDLIVSVFVCTTIRAKEVVMRLMAVVTVSDTR